MTLFSEKESFIVGKKVNNNNNQFKVEYKIKHKIIYGFEEKLFLKMLRI